MLNTRMRRTKIQQWQNSLKKIRPHLHDMKNDLNKSVKWKMHLIIKSKLMPSTCCKEKCTVYSKSDNSKL